MTFALTVDIILGAIVFIAIVGSLTWAIMASRDRQAAALMRINRLRGRLNPAQPSTSDGTAAAAVSQVSDTTASA